jgi:NADPH:quinone reductase-like Zn-dependent oxidoreductase
MRKVVIPSAGSYEKLQLEEHDDPTPGAGEVVVRVAAAGVNYADCVVRMGLYASAKEYVGWPITPGFEVAGDVLAVGPGVDRWARGDRVIAVTRFGGYASRVVVPAWQVFRAPEELELAEAAAIPAVHLTAYYALFELCRLRPGMKVLVHSAAGGVGGALCAFARDAGAEVVGVVGGPHKLATAARMGAHHAIDKSATPLWDAARELAPEGFDVVLDANGAETLRASYAALRPTGRLVVYGFHTMLPREGGSPRWLRLAWDWLRTPRFDPLDLCTKNRSVLGFNLSYLFDRREFLEDGLRHTFERLADGRLPRPEITRFPVDRVADAHRALESGQTVGKLVLTFGG